MRIKNLNLQTTLWSAQLTIECDMKEAAEDCNKYLKKGSMVAVDGRIQTGSYDGKDGKKVYTTDVVANRVEFLTKPNSGGH